MNRRYSNLTVFVLLFTDILALNIIGSILPFFENAFYSRFAMFNNLAWLLSSYLAAQYCISKKTWGSKLIKASVSGYSLLLIFNWAVYAAGSPDANGKFVIMALLIFGLYLLLCRVMVIGVRNMLAGNEQVCRKIIIIGNNETTNYLLQQFENKGFLYSLIGVFTDEGPLSSLKGHVKGEINECANFAIANQVKDIYSTISPEQDRRLYNIAEIAEQNFIQFKVVPNIDHFLSRKTNKELDIELPVLSLTPEPEADLPGQIQKRAFDVLFSAFVIIFILSWLAPILAVLIKLESAGPIFFKQMRTGKNGRSFLCFKFRSLKLNNEADSKQVTANDDRCTRIGKFMRKTNLDELPQFFNVLLGDMSVVGSRPHMLKHTEDFSRLHSRYMTRHYVKPGLTGWAQVNGYRGEIKANEQLIKRVEHDIWYMENQDFWLDMRIILQTVSSTFKGDKNAY